MTSWQERRSDGEVLRSTTNWIQIQTVQDILSPHGLIPFVIRTSKMRIRVNIHWAIIPGATFEIVNKWNSTYINQSGEMLLVKASILKSPCRQFQLVQLLIADILNIWGPRESMLPHHTRHCAKHITGFCSLNPSSHSVLFWTLRDK